MSDEEEEKGFLARWSQRKREAAKAEPQQTEADKPEQQAAEPSTASGDAEPPFDLESLPKLEELTKDTDMTVFFRKGVPESIRNAALRKSWALDPAIRNYVNPALEYAYDWNVPGGVPGTGEIGAGMDVARMVLQIMGGGAPSESEVPADAAKQPADDATLSDKQIGEQGTEPAPDLPTEPLRLTDAGTPVAQETATVDQNAGLEDSRAVVGEADNSAAPQQPVRRHGSAKPLD